MEEVDRLMVSESQSTQARNTLLKNQLQKLKGKSVCSANHATSCCRTRYRVNKVNHTTRACKILLKIQLQGLNTLCKIKL